MNRSRRGSLGSAVRAAGAGRGMDAAVVAVVAVVVIVAGAAVL